MWNWVHQPLTGKWKNDRNVGPGNDVGPTRIQPPDKDRCNQSSWWSVYSKVKGGTIFSDPFSACMVAPTLFIKVPDFHVNFDWQQNERTMLW